MIEISACSLDVSFNDAKAVETCIKLEAETQIERSTEGGCRKLKILSIFDPEIKQKN